MFFMPTLMADLWSRKGTRSLHTSAKGSKPEEVRLLIYGAVMRLIASLWLKIRETMFGRSKEKVRDSKVPRATV